jgi:ribonuclease BN (tRNA processing enzyme)
MPLQFTVLASGSSGNACLLQLDGFGLLLDAGLGPRTLKQRLETVGASWNHVHAVLLTHTHSDHWRETTFGHLHRERIPLHCHAGHHDGLLTYSPSFAKMREVKLVRVYDSREFVLAPGLRCRPLPLSHDCGPTFGFRFDYFDSASGSTCALAYVADLGSWDMELAELLADVDLLALEFNHDVELEQNSGRSSDLIERILGDDGHLSNSQAAALLGEILRRSPAGRLKHLVQLHLSRDCNRAELAQAAARAILADHVAVELHTASQDEVGPTLVIGPHLNGTAAVPLNRPVANRVKTSHLSISVQPLLPGMEE